MQEYSLIPGSYFFKEDMPVYTLLSEESPYMMSHRHDYVEIAYVAEGSGFHYIEDQVMPVSEGDLFVITAGVSHVFQPMYLGAEYKPLRVQNCLLRAEYFQANTPSCFPAWQVYREHQDEFKRLLGTMMDEQQNPRGASKEKLQSLGLTLIDLLMSKPEKEKLRYVERDEAPIHKALHNMGSLFMSPLTISDMSKTVAMSARHFQRMFKAVSGRSFIQMLQEIRIQHSCGMLRFTPWSVQSIAERVGIYDMNYFYRLFRAWYGMTPARFRNMIKQQEDMPVI